MPDNLMSVSFSRCEEMWRSVRLRQLHGLRLTLVTVSKAILNILFIDHLKWAAREVFQKSNHGKWGVDREVAIIATSLGICSLYLIINHSAARPATNRMTNEMRPGRLRESMMLTIC